jgi:hypothetical protein
MSGRVSLGLAVLVVVLGYGYTQPPPAAVPPAVVPIPPVAVRPTAVPQVSPGLPGVVTPTAPQAPREKSLDQMLDELESLRAKKAEIEKAEQELIKAIRQKAEKQVERMKLLGVEPSGAKRVGRIVIQGNTITEDGVILDMVDLRPGQVIEPSRLEEANARLKKAEKKRKFQSATVELMPNEWDSIYLDVLVKVKEKE